MPYRILAVNPGSTSTKLAVYNDDTPVISLSIPHSADDLAPFKTVNDQFHWRRDLVIN